MAVLALALAAAVWWVGSGGRPAPDAVPAAPSASTSAGFSSASPVVAPSRSGRALDVLHRWDRARADAYAAGDVMTLRSLYVEGSSAGTADARMLRSYLSRGLRVERMRMQVLAVRVLAQAPGRWRLLVTDRLDLAVAVGHGVRRPLPRDEASTRVVTLRRTDSWQVASVRRPPTPVEPGESRG